MKIAIFLFFFQVIANATYNSAILTLPDYDANSSLIVGEGFKGCILQGPGILFNESINNGAVFGPCPMDTKGCENQNPSSCCEQFCIVL
jgi:protein crumbs